MVGTEELFQDLCCRTTFDTVSRVIVRNRWCRHQWGPRRVDLSSRVAVGVRVLDRGDRSPVVVGLVLGVEGGDVAVRECHVQEAEQAGGLPQIEPFPGGDGPRNPVPREWGALDPEQGHLGLVGGAGAWRADAIAT